MKIEGIYLSLRIHRDLREACHYCGVKRVARLMSEAKIRSVQGYKRPRHLSGKHAKKAPNRLLQQFTIENPDAARVTDITDIRTYEGWLYIAIVIGVYSRTVVSWSTKHNMKTDNVLKALIMDVWWRKPEQPVIIDSDQVRLFASDDFAQWRKENRLIPSMSR